MMQPRNFLTYIIIAIIAIGIVAFVAASNTVQAPTLPGGAPITGSSEQTIALNATGNSGENGTANLESVNDGTQTRVKIDLANMPGNPQPAHIHIGACPVPGEIKYPLTDLVNGESETIINVAYTALANMGPLAVNVHQSSSDLATSVACADLKF